MSYPEKYDIKFKRWSFDTLPFLPREFKYEVIPGVKKQFEIVKGLLNRPDVDTIYVCTDSGREGEYIYRLVAQAGRRKRGKSRNVCGSTPRQRKRSARESVKQRIYQSMIIWQHLRISAQRKIILMGINFSRLLTLHYGNSISNYLHSKYSGVLPWACDDLCPRHGRAQRTGDPCLCEDTVLPVS